MTAQHEVAEGKVTPLPRDEGRPPASEPARRGASAPTAAEELQELLHALKRRVPRTGRAEEAAIARDSAELADVATERLKTLGAPAARAR